MVLTGLFLIRVLAQALQLFFNLNWLPSFGTWQSGALPYQYLVIFQILILAICVKILLQFKGEYPAPNVRKGKILLILGGIYFASMIGRLVIGSIIKEGHFWFDAPLPSFFHLVLASIVLLLGYYHYKESKSSRA